MYGRLTARSSHLLLDEVSQDCRRRLEPYTSDINDHDRYVCESGVFGHRYNSDAYLGHLFGDGYVS